VERKLIISTWPSTKVRTFLICLFFLFYVSTAVATEYTVRPSLSEEFGTSVTGEEVQELEVKTIPYWIFLLMLGITHVSSAPEILFPMLGGYKKIDTLNSLENPVRKRIYDFIKRCPGTYVSEIVKENKLNRGTARYHLNILETGNIIESYNTKGKIRYFQNGSTYDEKDKTIIAALKNDIDRRIILAIINGQCNTNGDLAEKLGFSKPTINWHISNLKQKGIVKDNKKGWYRTYSINPEYCKKYRKLYPAIHKQTPA